MENEINLKELQQKSLELLLEFDAFCKKHNKKIFVIGGGLIGAVRHKGFIPWDKIAIFGLWLQMLFKM